MLNRCCLLGTALLCVFSSGLLDRPARSQEPSSQDEIRDGSRHWAVLIVGLPGDDSHAQRFASTSATWQEQLIKLGIPAEHITLLSDRAIGSQSPEQSLTRETLVTRFTELGQKIQPADTLWVFMLGHGNYDEGRAAFHVRGVDAEDTDLTSAFDSVHCRQQVVWLTHSCSGWFLKRLSLPTRIVIAATAADQEPNETEFPDALANVLKQPPSELDSDHDQCVSVLELFAATVRETEKLYAADKRLPTEHAQLDDNGDGKGTELEDIKPPKVAASDTPPAAAAAASAANDQPDGTQARLTMLPFIVPADNETNANPSPENNAETP